MIADPHSEQLPETVVGEAGRDLVTDDEIFVSIYPELRRFAAVVGPIGTDPNDLVQEAVSRVLRRGSLTALDNPGAYLRRAIVNLSANERRRLGRLRRVRARVAPADDCQIATYPSDLADLLRLPSRDRAALWLVDVEGWSSGAVADLLGCTADAARARASRARRSLRRTITEEE